jgi:phosphatidylglycerol:prolipoprotein diacylglycerol transferase
MYPVIPVGPFSLSSSGLFLLLALFVGHWRLQQVARKRGGGELAAQTDSCFFIAGLGAFVGARLWYGLFNWDIYSQQPGMFLALQINGLAWPGALIGGALVSLLWGRWRGFKMLAVADSAALALPAAQAIASIGLLLSGEAPGIPTSFPWGIPLLGALRHPTQIYMALAALLTLAALHWLARRPLPQGALLAGYLAVQGVSMLLIEPLRADSLLLPGGIRVAQVFGLALLLIALAWARHHALSAAADSAAPAEQPPAA